MQPIYVPCSESQVLDQQSSARAERGLVRLALMEREPWLVRIEGHELVLDGHAVRTVTILVPDASDAFDARFRACYALHQVYPNIREHTVHASPLHCDMVTISVDE